MVIFWVGREYFWLKREVRQTWDKVQTLEHTVELKLHVTMSQIAVAGGACHFCGWQPMRLQTQNTPFMIERVADFRENVMMSLCKACKMFAWNSLFLLSRLANELQVHLLQAKNTNKAVVAKTTIPAIKTKPVTSKPRICYVILEGCPNGDHANFSIQKCLVNVVRWIRLASSTTERSTWTQ